MIDKAPLSIGKFYKVKCTKEWNAFNIRNNNYTCSVHSGNTVLLLEVKKVKPAENNSLSKTRYKVLTDLGLTVYLYESEGSSLMDPNS